MEFTFTTGDFVQILTTTIAAVAIVVKLSGRVDNLTALFRQHEEFDKERFDGIKADLRSIKHNLYEE